MSAVITEDMNFYFNEDSESLESQVTEEQARALGIDPDAIGDGGKLPSGLRYRLEGENIIVALNLAQGSLFYEIIIGPPLQVVV